MNKILELGEHTKTLFQIELSENGTYLAVRTESPLFCLHGDSVEDACLKAVEALEFYKELKHKGK